MGEFTVTHGDGEVRVALAPVIDLIAAENLKDALLDATSGSAGVVIEGNTVERIDTPGLQILLAAAAVLDADNRGFSLVEPSSALTEAMTDMGFSAELDRWRVL